MKDSGFKEETRPTLEMKDALAYNDKGEGEGLSPPNDGWLVCHCHLLIGCFVSLALLGIPHERTSCKKIEQEHDPSQHEAVSIVVRCAGGVHHGQELPLIVNALHQYFYHHKYGQTRYEMDAARQPLECIPRVVEGVDREEEPHHHDHQTDYGEHDLCASEIKDSRIQHGI